MTFYRVTTGRLSLTNPDAPKSGWARAKSEAYRFRSRARAKRYAARARKSGRSARVLPL